MNWLGVRFPPAWNFAFRRTAIVAASAITLCATCLSTDVSAQAFKFYRQTIGNQLAAGMDASGLSLAFGTNLNPNPTFQANGSIVKAKDRNGGAFVNLARGPNPGSTWKYDGTLGGFSVTADPAAPFANNSNADIRWNYKFPAVPIRSGTWRDNNDAALGAVTLINAVGEIDMDQFNLASLKLINDTNAAVTFDNIRVYLNQDMANYTIDNFDVPSVAAINLPIQIVPANSSSPPIPLGVVDPSKYHLMTADVSASSLSEVFGIATAATAIPEPSTALLAFSGALLMSRYIARKRSKAGDGGHECQL
jgi:hypothetical protein